MPHTPGPWRIVIKNKRHHGPIYCIEQVAERYPDSDIVKDAHLQIATLCSHRFGAADRVPGDGMRDLATSEREGCQSHNAALIAAAPDLLAALQRMMPAGPWPALWSADDVLVCQFCGEEIVQLNKELEAHEVCESDPVCPNVGCVGREARAAIAKVEGRE